MKGKIARVTDRGYGFITPETGDKDLFFHAKSLQGISFDQLNENDPVIFDVEEGQKGPSATNVAPADPATDSDTDTAA